MSAASGMSIVKALIDAHGATFYDRDTGETLDAGQAVCRQVWGPNWMHDPEFQAMDARNDIPANYIIAAGKMVRELPAWCQPKAKP